VNIWLDSSRRAGLTWLGEYSAENWWLSLPLRLDRRIHWKKRVCVQPSISWIYYILIIIIMQQTFDSIFWQQVDLKKGKRFWRCILSNSVVFFGFIFTFQGDSRRDLIGVFPFLSVLLQLLLLCSVIDLLDFIFRCSISRSDWKSFWRNLCSA
jgi:hypothetical protein